MDLAKNGNFSTNGSDSVFYSGKYTQGPEAGRKASEVATQFAKENGAKTLEMTEAGSMLDKMGLYSGKHGISIKEADEIFSIASTNFAKSSVGNAHIFLGDSFSTSSILIQNEVPAIITNSNIPSIIFH